MFWQNKGKCAKIVIVNLEICNYNSGGAKLYTINQNGAKPYFVNQNGGKSNLSDRPN